MYADFWLADSLTFDARERIIASQNKFTKLTFAGGQAVASRHPFIRYPPYERKVEAARHGFARSGIPSRTAPIDLPGLRRALASRSSSALSRN